MYRFLFFLFIAVLFACKKDDASPNEPIPSNPSSEYYFPAIGSNNWSTQNMEDLNWNSSDTTILYDFLSQHGTRAFIILHKGKIVIEKYWGNDILDNAPFNQNSSW